MKKYTIFELQSESGLTMFQLRHRIRTLSIKAQNREYYFESDLQLILSYQSTNKRNSYNIYESSLNLTRHENDNKDSIINLLSDCELYIYCNVCD